MATSYTSGLRLTNQPTGGNANTWGTIADTNFEHIDDAITGVVCVDITGASSHALTTNNGSDDEARNAIIKITGTPSSANSVFIPAVEKKYVVHTSYTSVNGGITVKTSAGTGITFEASAVQDIYCDGVSVYLRNQVSALDPSNNLSDVAEASASRNNLGIKEDFATKELGDHLETSGSTVGVNVSSLFDIIWPVGSLYSNRTDGTNPGTLMGFGTWASAGMARVPIGVGTGVDVNGVSAIVSAETCGGEFEHILTTAELTEHTHDYIYRQGGAQGAAADPSGINVKADTTATEATGSSEAFNIQQPWYSVYMWVRTA